MSIWNYEFLLNILLSASLSEAMASLQLITCFDQAVGPPSTTWQQTTGWLLGYRAAGWDVILTYARYLWMQNGLLNVTCANLNGRALQGSPFTYVYASMCWSIYMCEPSNNFLIRQRKWKYQWPLNHLLIASIRKRYLGPLYPSVKYEYWSLHTKKKKGPRGETSTWANQLI